MWPYLERFARDATAAVKKELHTAGHGENPDFIIGNYSDGNLVASLMSHALGVTQCNIAHALEKTKYNDADINWYVFDGLVNTYSCLHILLCAWLSATCIPICITVSILGSQQCV